MTADAAPVPTEAGPHCSACSARKLAMRSGLAAHAWCFGCGAQHPGLAALEEMQIRAGESLRTEQLAAPKRITIPKG